MIHAENKSHITEDICFYATVDNHKWSYLFDCGRARYLKASDCKQIIAIFITHTHIDHFCNFDTLLRHQISLGRVVNIFGPPGIARNVQAKTHSYTWNLIRKKAIIYHIYELHDKEIKAFRIYPPKWEIEEMDSPNFEGNICFQNDGIFVRYETLDHKIPSIAYLIYEESKTNIKDFPFKPGPWVKELKEAYEKNQADQEIIIDAKTYQASELFSYLYTKPGHRLGYAMDHLPSEENHQKLISLWKDADEVVIESFFRDCDKSYALKHHHSTITESGKVARLAGAKKATLVHHSRRYFNELKDMLEEGRASFENREPQYTSQPVAKYTDQEDDIDNEL